MRVLIDATPLLLRSAGVKTYVFEWIRHLEKARGNHRIGLFPLLGELGECDHERSAASAMRTVAGIALLQAGNYIGGPVLRSLGARADIFHHTSQQLRRAPRGCLITATLHDMTCWLMPEMHSQANVQANLQFAENVLRRAAGMIAVSAHTRDDAARILGLDPARIRVIHPGVAPAYFDAAADAAVAARYGLAKPYVLSVGTVEPRKNFGTLLEAWGQLPADLRQEYDLAVAGPAGWGDPAVLRRLQTGEAGVRYLGYVPQADLPALTAAAAVFAYPSLYEGFGFPLAQAMAAGTAAVTSAVSSMPEVAGDAAVLVDPRSAAEIRAALERLLCDAGLRADLGARGRRRAERFRWEKTAAESWRFFEAVLR